MTPLDWLLILFGQIQKTSVIILSTVVTLFVLGPLYRWVQNLIDYLCFPDSVGFREEIDTACRELTRIDARPDLENFLANTLPDRLQITYVLLQEDSKPRPPDALRLPLEMGERILGTLSIGPKRSGRTFSGAEQMALKQLQEQVSLVLSFVQLAEARRVAEQTGQLKSNFLSNLSHELRTPLNSVINSTGLVADGILGQVNEEHVEYLQRAVRGSEHLMNVLDEILDITKIETGQLTLRFAIMNLEEVIEEALAMVRSMLQNKPVQLKADLAENLPPLYADRLRVRQILLNILANAVKFTKEGFILVKAWPANERIFVSIRDTGIGITEDNLSLIFKDYQQVLAYGSSDNLPTRRRHFGTGLGMPIARALVELHGGQISVESEPGQGSVFTIALPLSMVPISRPSSPVMSRPVQLKREL